MFSALVWRTPAQRIAGLLVGMLFVLGGQLLLPGSAHALIQTGTPWPDGRVPVCWRSDADDHDYHASNAAVVRDAVENQWGRVANLTFVGWGICPGAELNEPAGTVVIHWEDDDVNKGSKADVGYYPDKRTFVRLAPMGAPTSTGPRTEAQFRSDVLHEFGHALGFWHEHNHPERNGQAPGICAGDPATNATVLTPFDVTSIMAWTYCYYPPANPGPAAISPWDIVGVQRLYGRKPAGSVVGLGNSCLDVPKASTTIGIDLQVFNCHGDDNQRWDYRPDRTFRATIAGQPRCADVAGGTVSSTSGTVLQSQACDGTSSQQFSFAGVELRGIGDKCVDVPSANYATGQYVQLFDCQGSGNQHWHLLGNSIKSTVSNYCLDVPGGSAVVGRLLQLAPCTYGASQQFTLTDAGQIQFGGLCVDSQGGAPVNGARLQLYSCKSGTWEMRNQVWHLTGAIRGLGGQCLDIKGGLGIDRAKVQLYPCTGNPNQRWDYYFD